MFPSRKQDDGSNLYLNAHKIRSAPIWPNMNKQTHLSFKTEVGHPDYHVLVSTLFLHNLFSLYIPLQSCRYHANRWDGTAKASGGLLLICVVTTFILYHQELAS